MNGIVTSQCLWSKDAAFVMRYLTFNISMFKFVKKNSGTIKHIYNESVNIIEGCNVAFDTNDCWNFPKRCQWLALSIWWHALTFITHKITWCRAYVAKLSPRLWKNWCHFRAKSTQSYYNTMQWIGIAIHRSQTHNMICSLWNNELL